MSDHLTARRDVLKALAAATLAESAFSQQTSPGGMIYRNFGKTSDKVSAIGLGGYHIGAVATQAESVKIVRSAIDRGITFLDNCWDYNGGRSEEWMGAGLRDGYRQRVFLMTKFDGRTKELAAKQIDQSLKRLQTDHLDLIQFHENIRMTDPDRFFAPGGAMEAVAAARKAGKTRYIGFTGHKDPNIHLKMLQLADEHKFHFDSAQMPLNVMDAQFRSFAKLVVPVLVEKGMAVLGMKPLANGAIPSSKLVSAVDCLHYALTLPTTVVINGCDSMERLDQAFEAARTFRPLTEAQIASLLEKTRSASISGEYEKFKTSTQYDGTAANPQWMG